MLPEVLGLLLKEDWQGQKLGGSMVLDYWAGFAQ